MENLRNVKHVILVLSGKGGVGKSMVASEMALCLAADGKKVGLLDIDLCGPSIPKILGMQEQKVHQSSAGWIPVFADAKKNLAVMSIGFLLANPDDAVVWRGPKKTAMIRQFLSDVCWEELDFLIVDTPPGTSDEHIAIAESLQQLKADGAVLVTTPQLVSIDDVRREITFCRKAKLDILGIVENMSGYTCPHCKHCTNIFSSGGGEQLAEISAVPFLGRVPLDAMLALAMEKGESFVERYASSESAMALRQIVEKIVAKLSTEPVLMDR